MVKNDIKGAKALNAGCFGLIMITALILMAAASRSPAQTCMEMPPESDFKFEVLSAREITGNAFDLAVAPDLKVYWVERTGAFKVYDPRTKAITLLRQFPVLYADNSGSYTGSVESGLEGVALDGNFEVNHWVYLRYGVPKTRLPAYTPGQLAPIERVSRFTLHADGLQLDTTSEKIILEHKVFAQCCHFGGDLDWGPDGNLWLTTGDNMIPGNSNSDPFKEGAANTDVRSTAGNTGDLRGKVLRFRPLAFPDNQTPPPGEGSTYSIPAGNLRDHFGKQGYWSVPEQEKVRPEIFSMGHRNPFSMAIHPRKYFPALGEAGGGGGTSEDEINIAVAPANFGWPFFLGGNAEYQQGSLAQKVSAEAPMNRSRWNTGVEKLPPAQGAAISNRTAAVKHGMSCLGVVVAWGRYEPGMISTVKFPPALDGKLLFSSYGRVDMMAATVDDKGAVTKVETLFRARSEIQDIHRAEFGPDGALYIAGGQYTFGSSTTSKIVKVTYTGPCSKVTASPASHRPKVESRDQRLIVNASGKVVNLPEGTSAVQVRDLRGKLLWEVHGLGRGQSIMHLPPFLPPGLLQIGFRNIKGG